MLIDEGKLTFTFTKAFELLSDAVKLTNSSKMIKSEKIKKQIFEPREKLDPITQTGILQAYRPVWLPDP